MYTNLGGDICYVIQLLFFICFIHMLSHCRQMATHNQNSINCILRSEALCSLYNGKKLKNLLSISLIAIFDRYYWKTQPSVAQ